jgi:hypothetical protein
MILKIFKGTSVTIWCSRYRAAADVSTTEIRPDSTESQTSFIYETKWFLRGLQASRSSLSCSRRCLVVYGYEWINIGFALRCPIPLHSNHQVLLSQKRVLHSIVSRLQQHFSSRTADYLNASIRAQRGEIDYHHISRGPQ